MVRFHCSMSNFEIHWEDKTSWHCHELSHESITLPLFGQWITKCVWCFVKMHFQELLKLKQQLPVYVWLTSTNCCSKHLGHAQLKPEPNYFPIIFYVVSFVFCMQTKMDQMTQRTEKKNNDYLSNEICVNGVVFYFHFTFNFILYPKASNSKLETCECSNSFFPPVFTLYMCLVQK